MKTTLSVLLMLVLCGLPGSLVYWVLHRRRPDPLKAFWGEY